MSRTCLISSGFGEQLLHQNRSRQNRMDVCLRCWALICFLMGLHLVTSAIVPTTIESFLSNATMFPDWASMEAYENMTNMAENVVLIPKPKGAFNSSEIRLGFITSLKKRKGTYFPPASLIGGAFTYAVEKVNNDSSILPDHRLTFDMAETFGEEIISIRQTAKFIQNGIHAIIGPQETCVHEARLATAFNVPMLSYYCTDAEVSNRHLYPTFARTKPTDSQISGSVVSILKLYKWNRVTFIHKQADRFNITADTIYELMEKHKILVTYRRTYTGPYFHGHQINPFVKIVSETRHNTRIYVVLADSFEFVGLMEHLQTLGLIDTGEYFVVGVTWETYSLDKPKEFLQGIFNYNVTNQTMKAYRHFLSIIHTPPLDPKYEDFKATVDRYLELPPFNLKNVYKYAKKQRDIKSEAAYLHDAVIIYAQVVHKLLQEGKDPRDGLEVIGRIQGMEYKSAFGYLSKINENGDALGNFSIIVRKHTNGGEWGMFPVGTFRLDANGGPLPTFHFHKGENIRWINGHPPVDEPECGFYRERCIPVKTYTMEIAGSVTGGLIFLIVFIGYIFYSNYRYEQELTGLLWKIDYDKEITFSSLPHAHQTQNKSPLRKSASQASLISAADIDIRQLFTHVGVYRGSVVAVKKLNKTHVELTRNVKKELKLMREMRHDNINGLIGACVDPPNVAIVTAYCSKGSLQDILENEDIMLDSMFVSSLVLDIIKGMIYLHGSELLSHGKLKSSNCVVDSRWVLKITDYGLHTFTANGQNPHGEYAFYRNLLWKAPELIRDKNSRSRGSQEGDVYSFAIILFEINSRNGPYGKCELTPKEIIERIMTRPETNYPFRPRLSEISSTPKFVTDVIKECWDEDPLKRPDFKTLRIKLKPMQKGMKANIFDNMMSMMERYASNLESLVQSRTDELIEEKKKTEELLQDMLPGTVADQLMHGKQVEAEGFDKATIYFSDICGFTALSAESTPMQIVDMLNDLYTLFDSVIEFYDVYKVETIGDAYMVVSGLPQRNGNRHAGEIASMAVHLLQELKAFKIPHRPDDTMCIRIGVHTGPVVAGVVGRKMPRYCLFGDTVNVASRMESNGQALKIHISEPTMKLLVEIGGFELQERGNIDIKGKGIMKTYWLTGEDPNRRQKRMQRGMARMERSCSTRRRNKMPDKPSTPNYNFRNEGSPQFSHQCVSSTVSLGHHSVDSPTFKSNNYLHPFSLLVGPTSQELMRRSSSRRRRLKFHLENDDCSTSGDELEPLVFTADSIPTIIRTQHIAESTTPNTLPNIESGEHPLILESAKLNTPPPYTVKVESFVFDGDKAPKHHKDHNAGCMQTSARAPDKKKDHVVLDLEREMSEFVGNTWMSAKDVSGLNGYNGNNAFNTVLLARDDSELRNYSKSPFGSKKKVDMDDLSLDESSMSFIGCNNSSNTDGYTNSDISMDILQPKASREQFDTYAPVVLSDQSNDLSGSDSVQEGTPLLSQRGADVNRGLVNCYDDEAPL